LNKNVRANHTRTALENNLSLRLLNRKWRWELQATSGHAESSC